MRFAGIISEDEPDPRLRRREQAQQVPIFGLVRQPHLEDWDAIGIGSGTRDGVLNSCEASISYTLWRNPDEVDDPVNLAELDQLQCSALEVEPPRPRPPWLVEQVRRMRYPMLWECVRTHWCRRPREFDSAPALLVAHVNDILVNRFQQVGVMGDDAPHDLADPQVYGLGVDLDAQTVLTAAIPRDALPYLEVTFATRSV